MIYTSSYKNFSSDILKGVSISGDKGRDANWYGNYYSLLAPKKEFWKIWHDNIGKVDEVENNKYYIEQYYMQVLKNLNPLTIYRELNYSTLLCYEENNDFCHRHIVAAWFELLLGFEIEEVKVRGLHVERTDCELYNFIKESLLDVIKKVNGLDEYYNNEDFNSSINRIIKTDNNHTLKLKHNNTNK